MEKMTALQSITNRFDHENLRPESSPFNNAQKILNGASPSKRDTEAGFFGVKDNNSNNGSKNLLALIAVFLALNLAVMAASHSRSYDVPTEVIHTHVPGHLALALVKRERFFQMVKTNHNTKIVPANCTLVVSSGGVASTEMIKALYLDGTGCRLDVSDDDGLKHLPLDQLAAYIQFSSAQSSDLAKVDRILYIYDHPALSLMSLYRRNYSLSHCYKLRDDDCLGYPDHSFPDTVEKYAQLGDYFTFQNHINSYLSHSPDSIPGIRVGALRMSEFSQYYGEVADFLDLQTEFAVERMSNISANVVRRDEKYLEEPVYHKLMDIYHEFWNEIGKKPGFMIRVMPGQS
jgi:hypothetical protein